MRKSILLLSLFLSACVGSSPDSHFFTLSPVPPQEQPRPGRPALHISAFHVPELYDRPQMVFRSGAQSVDIDETDRWAEPLDRMAARILAQDLAQRRPQPAGDEVNIQVTVDDFIVERSGAAHFSGNWKAGAKSGVFDWTSEAGGASPDQAASALSALLGRLAGDLDRSL
jgi:uncharacterized lipoprotein YmbA